MGEYECCRWGSCVYTTTNNMFDVMRDLTRDGSGSRSAPYPCKHTKTSPCVRKIGISHY